ncbi:MAG: molybdate ABC transporter substrate-binding protein [Pseudomonadales bacterium]|nr:molybdate ABC transporter substrate-binding protein [Pseudomonadales bacterium]
MLWGWFCCGVFCALSLPASADTVSVAVAANFIKPMKLIARQFTEITGHHAQISFGSSGKLYAQIRNGAPFEVFLSADQSKPIALEQQGLAVPKSRFTYAIGTLILWSPEPILIKKNADILLGGDFNKLAIANPRLAPYGRAAIEVFDHLGITEQIKPKLIQGQNIAQAYQFVSSGNAQVGMIAGSQVTENGELARGSGWVIPKNLYSPIKQDAVLLAQGKNNLAAQALLEFIRSNRSILERFGYSDHSDSGLQK